MSADKTTPWRDVLPIHPAADLFPLMSPDELRALGEDIKKNGATASLVIFIPKKGEPELVDGRNRLDAMEAVGINVLDAVEQIKQVKAFDNHHKHTVEFEGLPKRRVPCVHVYEGRNDPYAYVVSANIHRRHLTAEQKRELIAKLVKATPEKSDRQIAETVKASPTTVGTVRAKMESAGDVSKLDTRRDAKGRQQPARRKDGWPRSRRQTYEAQKKAGIIGPGADRPQQPAKPPPDDIGPDSSGEIERLRARSEELAALTRRQARELDALRQPQSLEARLRASIEGLLDASRHAVSFENCIPPDYAPPEKEFEDAVSKLVALSKSKLMKDRWRAALQANADDGLDIPGFLRRDPAEASR